MPETTIIIQEDETVLVNGVKATSDILGDWESALYRIRVNLHRAEEEARIALLPKPTFEVKDGYVYVDDYQMESIEIAKKYTAHSMYWNRILRWCADSRNPICGKYDDLLFVRQLADFMKSVSVPQA